MPPSVSTVGENLTDVIDSLILIAQHTLSEIIASLNAMKKTALKLSDSKFYLEIIGK